MEYCAQHAPNGMTHVKSRKKCRTKGYGMAPSMGVAGTESVEHCARHALDGTVNLSSKWYRTESCGKI